MLMVRPFSRLLAKSVIPCDNGSTAAMNQAPIKENNSKQTAAVKASEKFALVFVLLVIQQNPQINSNREF